MASVEKRLRDGRVRWYARYRAPDGTQKTKTFSRKVDAERYLTGIESAKLTGSYIDPSRSRADVGAWADLWIDAQADLSPTTRNRYEGIIRTHIRPRWGQLRLSDVSHADVQRWVTGLCVAPATARKVHRVLSMMLAWAVADGRLARNPAEKISLPRVCRVRKAVPGPPPGGSAG